MKTRAPEFRALIIIFGSAGPVISTRRSSRSAGAAGTVQSAARRSAVAGSKSRSAPSSIAAWRRGGPARSASRRGPNAAWRSARNASASGRQDLVGAGAGRAAAISIIARILGRPRPDERQSGPRW